MEKLLSCAIQAVSAADLRMAMKMTNANKIQEKLYRPSLGAENTCNDSAKLPEESDAEVLFDRSWKDFVRKVINSL